MYQDTWQEVLNIAIIVTAAIGLLMIFIGIAKIFEALYIKSENERLRKRSEEIENEIENYHDINKRA